MFDLLIENSNLGYIFLLVGTGAHECFLLQDILMGTEKFDLGV
jgi:hypothetical protein